MRKVISQRQKEFLFCFSCWIHFSISFMNFHHNLIKLKKNLYDLYVLIFSHGFKDYEDFTQSCTEFFWNGLGWERCTESKASDVSLVLVSSFKFEVFWKTDWKNWDICHAVPTLRDHFSISFLWTFHHNLIKLGFSLNNIFIIFVLWKIQF